MVSVDTDSLFANYFKPKDLSLLSNLHFRVVEDLSSKMIHASPDKYDFMGDKSCDCAKTADFPSYVSLTELLDAKAKWAPCMLSAPVQNFVFSQLRTLEDAWRLLADFRLLEEFMSEESPSFDEVLSATRKMIGIATLTHSLGNAKINLTPGLANASLISEHVKTLLISNFKDDILNFFELKSPGLFDLITDSGPAWNFVLVDSESSFDSFSRYFMSLNPQGDPPMPLDHFDRNVEHMLAAYLLEIIRLSAFLTQVEFTFASGSATILKVDDPIADLILREVSNASRLYTAADLDQEELATFSSLIKLFAAKAQTRFRSNEQLVAEAFKPALSAFKAVRQ